MKRAFDIIASFVGLILLLPLFLVLAVLIKIRMPGPVFFRQKRIGRYGREFTIVKFRSMLVNHGGSTISIQGESRITPLGSKLRKYKLDELPELWNVLKGEMSFVGPRPDVAEFYDRLKGEERKILELRPGITGPASLKYVNEEAILAAQPDPLRYYEQVIWPDKVRINLEYHEQRSFMGDLALIFRTVLGRKTLSD